MKRIKLSTCFRGKPFRIFNVVLTLFVLSACDVDSESLEALAENNTAHSVARMWNEVLLDAIRNDLARPTVHARNLFHTSILMYDSWAIYTPEAETYLLGKNINDFSIDVSALKFANSSFCSSLSSVISRF